MSVKIVYLKNGTQLVGDVEEYSGDVVTIENPLMLIQTGPSQIGFTHYLQFTKDEVATFRRGDYLEVYSARDDIKEYWNKEFGAGIITPSNGIITG